MQGITTIWLVDRSNDTELPADWMIRDATELITWLEDVCIKSALSLVLAAISNMGRGMSSIV